MSSAGHETFLCPICLEVFTDAVSTPCGHNFCKDCITQVWDTRARCDCPQCKIVFRTRPELNVNALLLEMVAQFKGKGERSENSESSESSVSEPPAPKAGEVPCDVCTETKAKAIKSCLVCLVSYCEPHLEPHLTVSGLRKHQLGEPVKNLEGRMCQKHHKPLELFCRKEKMCVCALCTVSEHKTHKFVPLSEEFKRKKKELKTTEVQVKQMIQERQVKMEEVRRWVKMSRAAAEREKAEGVEVFTELMECVERALKQLKERIDEEESAKEREAEGFIRDLEEEIAELMKRSSEVEQLLQSQDHLNLLQTLSSLKEAPPTKDWTAVSICPSSHEGAVAKAVAQLKETLSKEMKKLSEDDLKEVQKFAVDVTLDADTAHPCLILSEDGRRVSDGDVEKKLPDNPERFSIYLYVLGKQSFSSGKFYFEVQVEGKTDWSLGVGKESISRKRNVTLSPARGFWLMGLVNGNEYRVHEDGGVRDLSLRSGPDKVGVFVDYKEGLVSFYDVKAAALIHTFTGCRFTEKLLPLFSPCCNDGDKNSAPLIICPVNQSV